MPERRWGRYFDKMVEKVEEPFRFLHGIDVVRAG